jgi:hypothetical protein
MRINKILRNRYFMTFHGYQISFIYSKNKPDAHLYG